MPVKRAYPREGVVDVSREFCLHMKGEISRTGTIIESFFLDKTPKPTPTPDGLNGAEALLIIRGAKKQAPKAWLEWLKAGYEQLPDGPKHHEKTRGTQSHYGPGYTGRTHRI